MRWPSSCYNNLHSFGKAFHLKLERGYGDLLPFRHKKISEIRQ